MTSHFLSINDLTGAELTGVLDAAEAYRSGEPLERLEPRRRPEAGRFAINRRPHPAAP